MNDKNKSAEFSYYGLYLLKYLRENHPDRASDTDFIEERARPCSRCVRTVPSGRGYTGRCAGAGNGGIASRLAFFQVQHRYRSVVERVCR